MSPSSLALPDMLADWPKQANHLAADFTTAKPFPHVVIDGFLKPGLCEKLAAEFPPYDEKFRTTNGGKAEYPNIGGLSPAFHAFDEAMRSPAFLKLVGKIAGIDGLVHDPRYHGGGAHEILDGMDNSIHLDFNRLVPTKLHRRLNIFLYLNPRWPARWGGLLQLHSDPLTPGRNRVKSVVPSMNRCVLFETSERSWHGVTRLRLPEDARDRSRRSIAVYLYTKNRPPSASPDARGTVYANRLLPQRLSQGHILGKSDVEELRWLNLPRRFASGYRLSEKDVVEIRKKTALATLAQRLLRESRAARRP